MYTTVQQHSSSCITSRPVSWCTCSLLPVSIFTARPSGASASQRPRHEEQYCVVCGVVRTGSGAMIQSMFIISAEVLHPCPPAAPDVAPSALHLEALGIVRRVRKRSVARRSRARAALPTIHARVSLQGASTPTSSPVHIRGIHMPCQGVVASASFRRKE